MTPTPTRDRRLRLFAVAVTIAGGVTTYLTQRAALNAGWSAWGRMLAALAVLVAVWVVGLAPLGVVYWRARRDRKRRRYEALRRTVLAGRHLPPRLTREYERDRERWEAQ